MILVLRHLLVTLPADRSEAKVGVVPLTYFFRAYENIHAGRIEGS
jgi:hypothetical protein